MANERYEGVGPNGHYTLSERIFTKIKNLFDTKVKTDVPANAVFTDTNTTYTLSADTANNKIKLTPNSGAAQSITVPYATSAGSATDNTKLPLAGGTMTGQIVLASNGYKTNNTAGYSADQYGNFQHLGTTTTDYWQLKSNNGTNKFSVYWETGNVTAAGNITAPKFIGNLQGTADYAASMAEANLTWGGKNFSGSYGCIDAALMDELGANRFQFIKADAITVEYSRDAGTTWTDYGATDAQKQQIFAQGGSLTIGKADSTHKATEHPGQYQLRITIDTGVANVYSYLNKFVIFVSTNNSGNCSCKIQKALQSTPTTFVDHTDWITVTGWSGYNVLNTSYLATYGNSPTSQYGRVRFVFKDSTSTGTSYNGLTILQIKGFGGVGWSCPSTMAKTSHIYSYNENQDVFFPANVTAPKFIGALQGNADTATSASKLGSSNVGSTTQPIYLNGGTATACTYTLGKSVPSNAVFTDEKVRQTESTSNENYEVLISGTASTATTIEGANKSRGFRYNPSKKAVMEGSNTTASGDYSHAEGENTKAIGQNSHAEGYQTCASGLGSHTEGGYTTASNYYAHAEGSGSYASGNYAHAEGYYTTSSGDYTHSEGQSTKALKNSSHAEGYQTCASGYYSHAEGQSTTSNSYGSHAEGYGTYAQGNYSHAEGQDTTAYSNYAHAEGNNCYAYNSGSHAEGRYTRANGQDSHTEGYHTYSEGLMSHAEGYYTTVSGNCSHAEGSYTRATHKSQHVFGEYNLFDTSTAGGNNRGNYVEIVGNGDNNGQRSNARTLDWNGNEKIAGNLTDKWGLQTSRTMFEEDFQQLTQAERDNGTNYYIPDREPLKICDYIYPVGAIYMSVNNISPAILFGGTWERIEDKFLLAAGSTYNAGSTGGEAEHTLTEAELPTISGSWQIHAQENGTIFYIANGYATGTLKSGQYKTQTTATSGAYSQASPGFKFGQDQPHNNMPPYLTVNVWVRVPDPVEQEEEEGE